MRIELSKRTPVGSSGLDETKKKKKKKFNSEFNYALKASVDFPKVSIHYILGYTVIQSLNDMFIFSLYLHIHSVNILIDNVFCTRHYFKHCGKYKGIYKALLFFL